MAAFAGKVANVGVLRVVALAATGPLPQTETGGTGNTTSLAGASDDGTTRQSFAARNIRAAGFVQLTRHVTTLATHVAEQVVATTALPQADTAFRPHTAGFTNSTDGCAAGESVGAAHSHATGFSFFGRNVAATAGKVTKKIRTAGPLTQTGAGLFRFFAGSTAPTNTVEVVSTRHADSAKFAKLTGDVAALTKKIAEHPTAAGTLTQATAAFRTLATSRAAPAHAVQAAATGHTGTTELPGFSRHVAALAAKIAEQTVATVSPTQPAAALLCLLAGVTGPIEAREGTTGTTVVQDAAALPAFETTPRPCLRSKAQLKNNKQSDPEAKAEGKAQRGKTRVWHGAISWRIGCLR